MTLRLAHLLPATGLLLGLACTETDKDEAEDDEESEDLDTDTDTDGATDGGGSQGEYAVIGGGFPTFPVIGPDMTILTNDLFPPTVPDVEALLDDAGM